MDADTRRDPHIEEAVAWQKEKEARRAAWEADRKAEAERREREEKQARLSDYLQRRTEAWESHTGTTPPSGMRRTWTQEFIDSTIIDEDVDLELRRARAAAESGW